MATPPRLRPLLSLLLLLRAAPHASAAAAVGAAPAVTGVTADSAAAGVCAVSTSTVPNTDLYYVAAFETRAEAAPADGTAPRILTLTTAAAPNLTLGGLQAGREYWLRGRSHNASAPTIARGWRAFEPPFTCTAAPAARQNLHAAGRPSALGMALAGAATVAVAQTAASQSAFMYLYRVSEYTDEVDFLSNHNSASEGGQAGFLTNTDVSEQAIPHLGYQGLLISEMQFMYLSPGCFSTSPERR